MNNIDDQNKIVSIPTVGLPATVSVGSDDYAYYVTYVSSGGKRAVLQRAKHADSGIVPDNNGTTVNIYLDKSGRWRTSGTCRWLVTLGIARHYMDPHF